MQTKPTKKNLLKKFKELQELRLIKMQQREQVVRTLQSFQQQLITIDQDIVQCDGALTVLDMFGGSQG